MNSFKDFNIEVHTNGFVGDKIRIDKIINREIVVHGHKIEDSKYPDKGNGKRLVLQIKVGGNDHIIFTGSITLMDQIKQVAHDKYPFTTTIVRENDRIQFS